jgi:hypothetical protein
MLRPKAVRKQMSEYAYHMMLWHWHRNNLQWATPIPFIFALMLESSKDIYK